MLKKFKDFILPQNHKPGMIVPKGGSCCKNCKFWDNTKNLCDNLYYQDWSGTKQIPTESDEYCSDWYEPR